MTFFHENIEDGLVNLIIEEYDPITEKFSEALNIDGSINLKYQYANNEILPPQITLCVELNSATQISSDVEIFISILYLDSFKGSIHVLANREVLKEDKRTVENGVKRIWRYTRPNKGDRITVSVPSDLRQVGATIDYLKLFVSDKPVDISSLNQESLNKVLHKQATRSLDIDEEYIAEGDHDVPLYLMRTETFTINVEIPQEHSQEVISSRPF